MTLAAPPLPKATHRLPLEVQNTVASPVVLSGCGLFSGQTVTVRVHPAPANHGIVFQRSDLKDAQVPALVHFVVKRPRRTALKSGEAVIDTCEHILSALAGLGIDNSLIELDAQELPGFDGSARPFLDALVEAGVKPLDTPRKRLVVSNPVVERRDDALIAVMPSEGPGMEIAFELDYGEHPPGRQVKVYNSTREDFASQYAPARTFVLEDEARALRDAGIGTHLSTSDVLVIGQNGPLDGNCFRFDDEPVRHKIVDLIGDLYLLGAPIQARIIAYKSSHALNHNVVRKLSSQLQASRHQDLAAHRSVMDIRKLARVLPHRYPMLLVDRVIELESDRRAVGIKNVTMNEPFFQGHYPGTPMMPGVLIVEAMAQLSGVLIAQTLEHTGKLAVLLSLDRVKLRRAVTPGDQLIMEAESVRVRRRIAHVRCRAYVSDNLAAEADVKFMLVDDEQY